MPKQIRPQVWPASPDPTPKEKTLWQRLCSILARAKNTVARFTKCLTEAFTQALATARKASRWCGSKILALRQKLRRENADG